MLKFNLKVPSFSNFPGGMPPNPLALVCYACLLYFAWYQDIPISLELRTKPISTKFIYFLSTYTLATSHNILY